MFTKKEIFSIPNILCYFRIGLVPIFLYTYFTAEGSEGDISWNTYFIKFK